MRYTRSIDYVARLQEMYPELKEGVIKKIIHEGCRNIAFNALKGNDVMIESSRKKVKLLMYHYGRKSEKSSKKHIE